MRRVVETRLKPRKTPRQTRSTASVGAIMQATVQVLLRDGRSKLTTTRIAERAGVSVGTLYQYFPNKSSLLQALLQQHLDGVAAAVETACAAAHGAPLARMAELLVSAFVQAKFCDVEASAALYAVSDDVEGKRLGRGMQARVINAMAALFATASDRRPAQPEVVAATLMSAMAGVSRTTLEGGGATRASMATMESELTRMARAYLEASAVQAGGGGASRSAVS